MMISHDFNEVMNIAADLISLPILFLVFFNKNLPKYRIFLLALLLIFFSHFLTIAEGYVFPNILNFLEHVSLTVSAVFFMIGIIKYFILEKNQ